MNISQYSYYSNTRDSSGRIPRVKDRNVCVRRIFLRIESRTKISRTYTGTPDNRINSVRDYTLTLSGSIISLNHRSIDTTDCFQYFQTIDCSCCYVDSYSEKQINVRVFYSYRYRYPVIYKYSTLNAIRSWKIKCRDSYFHCVL